MRINELCYNSNKDFNSRDFGLCVGFNLDRLGVME